MCACVSVCSRLKDIDADESYGGTLIIIIIIVIVPVVDASREFHSDNDIEIEDKKKKTITGTFFVIIAKIKARFSFCLDRYGCSGLITPLSTFLCGSSLRFVTDILKKDIGLRRRKTQC